MAALPERRLLGLLERRPEAASLDGMGEPGWDGLAALLSHPRGLLGAVERLNRFQRSLLELLCVAGGRLEPGQALEQGLEAPLLARGGAELGGFGLAYFEPTGELVAAPGAIHLVHRPGGLGSPAARLLENLTMELLRVIGGRLGLLEPPSRKPELKAAIAAALSRAGRVAEILETAPPAAAAAFQRLRRRGGTASLGDLSSDPLDYSRRWNPASASDGPWWLAMVGLALPDGSDRLYFEVPAEVELAIRGRLFPEWKPDPPELRPLPLAEPRHPLELVAEVGVLLQAWRSDPPAAIQQGGPGKRDLRRFAELARVDEEEAAAAVKLAFEAGLLEDVETVPEKRTRSRRSPRVLVSRRALVLVTAAAADWEELPEAERWLRLIEAWNPEGPHFRAVLDALAELPEGGAASARELADLVDWRRPGAFLGTDKAAEYVAEAGAALAWVGAGSGPTAIGLTRAGRAALRAGGPDLEALAACFPEPSSTCTVTADHRVIVPGPPAPALAALLNASADLESVHPARVYRLSESSLRRALDAGWEAAGLADRLAAHAPAGLPAGVAALIEDTGRRHGRLRVGEAGVYVRAEDEAILQQLLRSAALRSLQLKAIAPTVAITSSEDAAAVVGLLRKAGQMPVLEREARAAAPARRPAPARRRASRAAATPPGPGLDLEALARALRSGPAPGTSAGRAAATPDVRRALAAAARSGAVLEVGFRSDPQSPPRRQRLRPLWAGPDRFQAITEGMEQMVTIPFREVLWVGGPEAGREGVPLELNFGGD